MAHDPRRLPRDLPVPTDDGACAHLVGMEVPSVDLVASDGSVVNISSVCQGRAVVYAYPRTGVPGVEMPEGWDLIPGARGCTPQSCSYRDDNVRFTALGISVFGLSSQSHPAQSEFVAREHIPFLLLSDPEHSVASALRLPTFDVAGDRLHKRATLVVREGRIEHVRYPVFPPDEDAAAVLGWCERNWRDHE